jgi:lipopolysaccharide biosynthesis glycosyltransferase
VNTFCTIITGNYYAYALSLLESLKTHCKQTVTLHVFVSDESVDKAFLQDVEEQHTGLFFHYRDEVCAEMALKLFEKYHHSYMDAYRWSMKPVFMNYLIQDQGFEKVIYLDCDLYFYNNPDFIFDLLDKENVLLSPHWRCADNPELDFTNFKLNFQGGIYNGGFVGINSKGTAAMEYWANLCLAACEINFERGFYVDQKYLDILHSRFEGVGVLRHRGCNVASWNHTDNKRSINQNGEVVINEVFPIVFIHFTKGTMRSILNDLDGLLLPYFALYSDSVRKYNPKINLLEQVKQELKEVERKRMEDIPKMNALQKMRYTLGLRTRLNNLFSKNK